MTGPVLIAVGGNALIREGEPGSLALQAGRAQVLGETMADLLQSGWTPIVTHGNGPQVGFIMRRGELAAPYVEAERLPDLPLWLAVADSQGGIGHLLAAAFNEVLRRRGCHQSVAAIITHTVVDEHDPAFRQPSKPIGSHLDAATTQHLRSKSRWDLAEVSPGSFRRVVPSPVPLEILEVEGIRALVNAGVLVIAAGGGGIPVARRQDRLVPVDAVVDKDRASALLASALGVDTLVLVTGVDQLYVDFNGEQERALTTVSRRELAALAAEGHFPAGSMGPKVESALGFLERGGSNVIITSIDLVREALEGRAGTHVAADPW